MSKPYTKEMLREFDRLTDALSSRDQLKRISARFAVKAFEEKHGKEACREMFEVLQKRDKRKER